MGVVHLDAGVVIGLLDANDAHHSSAHRAIADVLRDGHGLAMAASAFAECLVGPYRRGKASVLVVHNLIERLPITVVSLDAETASTAARVRAQHVGLRLPDALVIATAVHHAAERLITTDRKWPTASTMKIKLLIEQI
ncbi:PIN domain-containing protein [Gemmatimonas sp.]|uniref:type II toxin-antitoxin system VapC family toxin n=1 Tax=Gemmatimonas sp. TaxID=1962908 RepID=UPI00286B880B|nr:PIN domain-containing protein [Gemmatimonas sp.]